MGWEERKRGWGAEGITLRRTKLLALGTTLQEVFPMTPPAPSGLGLDPSSGPLALQ